MSHAAAISAYYSARAHISLLELSDHMIDEISTLILETERDFDERNPACMPHVFQAKLDRWSYITNRIATTDQDPVTALKRSLRGLFAFAIECRALNRDWSQTTYHAGWQRRATDLEVNIDLFSKKGISDPAAAALRAIDAQKNRAITARTHAIDIFTRLCTLYPAEAAAILDRPAMMTFEQLSENLKDVFDPFAFRDTLIRSLPPGTAKVIVKTPMPAPDDFY